jgi:UDP-N-acetylmuramoyl-tripeptide--D-alanyl-D-alanine ligase
VSQVRLTPEWVARAVGGRLIDGEAGTDVRDVVIDSRVAGPGDLFVAIKGPRFDGHDFVADVLARGAAAAIVGKADVNVGLYQQGEGSDTGRGRRLRRPLTGAVIEVGDTVKALQDLAHAVRTASGTRVIAITGSAGKTTTKETIAAFLERRNTVVKNKGNLNNHIGLPLSLMQVRTAPDVAVMELGMNHAGEISALVAIAEPDVRVWTNVGDAHLGFFASPDAIADAKAEILERANASTVLVSNADDPRVMARVDGFAGRTITFGVSDRADVRAVSVDDRGLSGVRARVMTPAGEVVLDSPLLGRGNLSNLLAATAVAVDSGIPLDDIAETASHLRPAARRGAVVRLANGITVVDDSYNSSPSALATALGVIQTERSATRTIAVLGEMLELGDHSTRLHAESGRRAAHSGISHLYAIGGPAAQAMAEAAIEAGMPAAAVTWFASSEQAASVIADAVRPGDLVLVKGSRGIRTDVVADRITAAVA